MTTEELQTLLDAATPGPLEVSGHHIHTRHGYIVAHCPNSGRHADAESTAADATGMALWPTIAAELIAARTKLAAAEGALQEVAHFKPGAADHPMMIALSMAGIAQAALDAMEAAK